MTAMTRSQRQEEVEEGDSVPMEDDSFQVDEDVDLRSDLLKDMLSNSLVSSVNYSDILWTTGQAEWPESSHLECHQMRQASLTTPLTSPPTTLNHP
jgi:hypothetical protein